MEGVGTVGRRPSCEAAARDIAPEEVVLPIGEFDLEMTLESGQCFRWRRVGEREYVGIIGRSVVHARHVPRGHGRAGALAVRAVGGSIPDRLEALIVHYFDLARDYPAILRTLRRDQAFARVAPRRAGIHILRQVAVLQDGRVFFWEETLRAWIGGA